MRVTFPRSSASRPTRIREADFRRRVSLSRGCSLRRRTEFRRVRSSPPRKRRPDGARIPSCGQLLQFRFSKVQNEGLESHIQIHIVSTTRRRLWQGWEGRADRKATAQAAAHACLHIYIYIYIYIYLCIHVYNIYIYIYIYIHTYRYTYIHTYTYANNCTHTYLAR